MNGFFNEFFGNRMPPHGHCYLWDDRLVSLHVISDAVIVLAYFTIPMALVYLVRRRDDLHFNYIFNLFAVFIFACGATHLVNIYNVWYGAYWFSGSVKLVTALASAATAILVWPLIPKALAIPGTRDLEVLNGQLREKADHNARQARELEELSSDLEEQVRLRTAELENAKHLLEVNNRILEETNRELEQYARVTSHDLREPLKKIRSQAQLLGSKLRSREDEVLKTASDDILDTSERMTKLVESLLFYTRVQSTAPPEEPVKADEVLDEVLSDLSLQINQLGVSVIRNPLPALPVQRYHLHQIMLNLLSNAVSFRADDRRPMIEIGPLLPADGTRAGFRVKDNGVGIANQNHERVFRFVERGEDGGSGIGLAICKKVVDQYGGSIELESQEGEGSDFKIYFPLSEGKS